MHARIERILFGLIALLLVLGIAGCTTNPVTGEQQLSLVGQEQELAIGQKNYGPYRQAQGGDYVADPALVTYVQTVGQRLARVADRKLPYEFRVVNDDSPNAWALPGGKIAVNRGLLLELHNEAELAAVLAHEIVHAAAGHTAQSMQRGIFLQGALVAVGAALGGSDYQQLGNLGAALGANLVKSRYSRDAEREADSYGMRYMIRAGYDPAAAVTLQETFVRLAEGKRSDWLSGLFASHPPSRERVERNRRLLTQLGNPGGERGEARYRRAVAHLKRTKPAYEAYAQARKAAESKDYGLALRKLDQAIAIEPKEALFHTLRGEILEAQGKKDAAMRAFDRAVSLNPDYFMTRLQRGLLERELGRVAAAESDLKQSVRLLPTAEAYYALGLIAEKQGRPQQAVGFFQAVAASKSAVRQDAARRLAKLDLTKRPGHYLAASLLRGPGGELLLRLDNRSGVDVKDVRVAIGRATGLRFRAERILTLEGTLPADRRVTVKTGLRAANAKAAVGLQARVVGGRPLEH